ncbi:MAG: hypothetical protein K2M06_08525 [Muribaculaceae bacterium]|nr:hypothetical protein [Muribaculaceae bacterium]
MIEFILLIALGALALVSCSTHKLPAFSNQQWYVDTRNGNTISTSGLELAFGNEWMIKDTTLFQPLRQIENFPKLADYLAYGITRFPEIQVDSILFYQPARGLLFTTYHQVKPLKPSPKDNRMVLLQHIPYKDQNIAVFQIWASIPKGGKWWNEFPRGTFMNVDFGNLGNVGKISNLLQWSRNTAVENLRLSLTNQK